MNAILTHLLGAVRIKSEISVCRVKDGNPYQDMPLILLYAGVVELGRHKGLKIPWTLVSVPVRVRPSALTLSGSPAQFPLLSAARPTTSTPNREFSA